MKTILFTLLFSFILANSLQSQSYSNYWYFGNGGGLNFATTPPTPLNDGQIGHVEGCTTISDFDGNLLFYSEGSVIFNRNHQVMPNGSGLLGHSSAAMPTIVIPHPGNKYHFFVITVPAYESSDKWMRYSVVDRRLDGGLGDVIPGMKNIPLFPNSAEKVVAVKHPNDIYYWLVGRSRNSNTYYTFLIDCNGINVTPIVSNVGTWNLGFESHLNAWGSYMAISADATKIAAARRYPHNSSGSTGSLIELLDFDNNTGILSNAVSILSATMPYDVGWYGICFSPNGRVLYVTTKGGSLYQFDLDASNISASRINLGGTGENAIQIGRDRKLYVGESSTPSLGVIHNPDVVGTGCNFVTGQIPLNNITVALPSIATAFTLGFNTQNHCINDSIEFSFNNRYVYDSLRWDFGDVSSPTNFSTIEAPKHKYTTSGIYTVRLIRYLSCSDTVEQQITIYGSNINFIDTTLISCFGDTNGEITAMVTGNGAPFLYSWNTNPIQNTPTIQNLSAGNYILTVTDSMNCVTIDTFNLIQPDSFYLNNTSSVNAICQGDSFVITTNIVGGIQPHTITWDQGLSASFNHIVNPTSSTNYTAIIEDANRCRDTLNLMINVNPLPEIDFNATNSCEGQLTTFNSTSTINSGVISQTLWDINGDGVSDYTTSNSTHLYPNEGTYNVTLITISDLGCRDTLTKSVIVYPVPVSSFTYTNSCDEQAVTFNSTSTIVSGSISQTIWDIDTDGTTDYTTLNGSHIYPTNGNYNVTLIAVSNNGCQDTISQIATVYPLPAADFNFQNACHLSPVTFNSTSTILSGTIDQYFWDVQNDNIDDYVTSNGSHVYPSEGNYSLRHIVETNNGCRDTIIKTITVESKPTAQFSFMNACDGDSLLFVSQASVAYGTINQTLWDIGSDGNIDYTTTNGGHLFPVYGRYDITQIVVTSGGCSDTLEQEVLIYPLPIASWTSSSVCEGTQMTFNDLSSVTNLDNDLVTQWEWTFGDGNSSLQQNPLHLYNDEQIYNTQLVVTTNHGCKDTFINSVTVWPLPQVNFSPTDVCLDNLTNFQDLSSISNVHTTNSTIQWDWDFGDLAGGTSSFQNPSYAYSQDGTFNAKLVVTSNHNCKDSTTLNVTVHPKPVASFTGMNLTGCAPICSVISSTSTVNNPSSISNYTWKLSDGTTHIGSSPDFTICLDNQTPTILSFGLQLIVETDKGCIDSNEVLNYISVYNKPIASFYADPAELDSYNETTHFINQSIGADHYTWNFGDGNINTNSHSPTHSYPNEHTGFYNVILVASTNEGCIDSTHLVIKLLEKPIFYVPNAFTPDGNMSNQVFKPVFTSGFDLYNYRLMIFNRWGEMVFESYDTSVGWDGTFSGNGSICQDGTYTWKIEVKTIDLDERKVFAGHVSLLR